MTLTNDYMNKKNWTEELPGKWVHKVTGEWYLGDLTYLDIGQRYLAQFDHPYPRMQNEPGEIVVQEISPDKKYIKVNGKWTETTATMGARILAKLSQGDNKKED